MRIELPTFTLRTRRYLSWKAMGSDSIALLGFGDIDNLDLGEFVQALLAHFDAETGMIGASEWQIRLQHAMLIHPGGSAFQPARDFRRAIWIAAPHRSAQAKFRGVGAP